MASAQRVSATIKNDWYHAKNTRDGKKAFQKALRKYGFQVAESDGRPRVFSVSNADGGKPGEVIAKGQADDAEYLCPVSIGTPDKMFQLDFDTGSSDLWVRGKGQGGNTHATYDPSASSTAKQMQGSTWSITYGDHSSARGNVYQDTVTIGGIKVLNQAVEVATTVSPQFNRDSLDGLLGLAFGVMNTIKPKAQATPVENMIKQGNDKAQIFTSAFYSTRDDGHNPSFFTFGYIDEEIVGGQTILWAPLVPKNQGFWMVMNEAYTVNGTKHAQKGNTCIMDTGTSLCLVSDDVANNLYKGLEAEGLAKFDSDQGGWLISTKVTVDQMPTFSVDVGDHALTIQPEDLVFAEAEEGWWFGGVQSAGDIPLTILGDVVLKSIYAIWDVGNKRFGFVPKIEKTQNLAGFRKN